MTTTQKTTTPWIRYKDEQPQEPGLYEWRVPSKSVPGMVLIVAANMRMRGAGFETVLSPEFDYWDGYRVLVQCDVQWRETLFMPQTYENTPAVLSIEGLDISPCSHCRKKPRIKAHQTSNMGGIVLNPCPWNLNTWRFSCCAWGETPRMDDPREIERIRRATRGSHAPDLLEAMLLALEYWADRQQRYKNRSPVWVQKARAAVARTTGEHP